MALNNMKVSIGHSHQPPVLCQAALIVSLELLVCPPTCMPLQCTATIDRSTNSIDGAFSPRGPRQRPHGATSSWLRMAGSTATAKLTSLVHSVCTYKHSLATPAASGLRGKNVPEPIQIFDGSFFCTRNIMISSNIMMFGAAKNHDF